MARNITRTLLSDASATGNTQSWPGGRGTLCVEGTFGGATVTFQFKAPSNTWFSIDATNATFTTQGSCGFELHPCEIRASVSGGSPSALYAYAITNDGQ